MPAEQPQNPLIGICKDMVRQAVIRSSESFLAVDPIVLLALRWPEGRVHSKMAHPFRRVYAKYTGLRPVRLCSYHIYPTTFMSNR